MKTPKELQSIYSKLPKTELKSEKVELGIIDDLQKNNNTILKSVEKADNSWKTYQDYLSGADKPFTQMIKAREILLKDITSSESISKEYIKAANDLGVDGKSNKDYQKLEANIKSSENVLSTISSFKDPSSFQGA
tara:strand:- start:492 stop:896 length:405 start_codon:yes stop_codon:yes gene_type:complete